MQLVSLFHESTRSLMANRLRTGLAMLGIVIGVASVMVMIAVGEGSQLAVRRSIESLGSNILMIIPGSDSFGASTRSHQLTMNDVHALQNISSLVGVAPVTEPKFINIIYNSTSGLGQSIGTSPDFFRIREWGVTQGREFTDEDVQHNPRIVVLGQSLANSLFHDDEPIGKMVRVAGIPLTVIGVLKKKGHSPDGTDQDVLAVMPLIIVQQRMLGNPTAGGIDAILTKMRNGVSFAQVSRDIRDNLRSVRKLKPEQEDSFKIRNMSELAKSALKTGRVMTLLLGAIASVSLVVGGIGIMNIMLVSVTERTREIGIRKSIGARNSDIMIQFLLEAVLIALIGSAMGIVTGFSIIEFTNKYFGVVVVLSGAAVAVSVGTAMFVSLIFGYYPARKAARLLPVEALRFQ